MIIGPDAVSLTAALTLAESKNVPVLTKGALNSGSTAWAQNPAFLKSEKTGERSICISYDKGKVTAGQVLALVQQQGFVIEDVTTREADLEDVFVQLTSEVQAA